MEQGGNKVKDNKNKVVSDLELLHPELLSLDFIQLVLHERKIRVSSDLDHERLMELYIQHVLPQPQRDLPSSRWGKRMERTRVRQSTGCGRTHSSGIDNSRKRALVVFDSSCSNTDPTKVKKTEVTTEQEVKDRLKPPPSINLSNPIRKLSSTSPKASSSSTETTTSSNGKLGSPVSSAATLTVKLKPLRDSGSLDGPDTKKKINHVTWP